MLKFRDENTDIVIAHPENWIGHVAISYPTPDGRKQVQVSAGSLLAGQPIFTAGLPPEVFPGDVLLRATALCVDRFWRWKMVEAVEQAGIPSA